MSYDINSVNIIGRLTKDPEMRQTNSGKSVCSFSIAVNKGKDNTSFFDVSVWDKTADICGQYLSKGKQVALSGELVQQRWQDQNGQNKSKVSINARTVQFMSAPKTDDQPIDGNAITGNQPDDGVPF